MPPTGIQGGHKNLPEEQQPVPQTTIGDADKILLEEDEFRPTGIEGGHKNLPGEKKPAFNFKKLPAYKTSKKLPAEGQSSPTGIQGGHKNLPGGKKPALSFSKLAASKLPKKLLEEGQSPKSTWTPTPAIVANPAWMDTVVQAPPESKSATALPKAEPVTQPAPKSQSQSAVALPQPEPVTQPAMPQPEPEPVNPVDPSSVIDDPVAPANVSQMEWPEPPVDQQTADTSIDFEPFYTKTYKRSAHLAVGSDQISALEISDGPCKLYVRLNFDREQSWLELLSPWLSSLQSANFYPAWTARWQKHGNLWLLDLDYIPGTLVAVGVHDKLDFNYPAKVQAVEALRKILHPDNTYIQLFMPLLGVCIASRTRARNVHLYDEEIVQRRSPQAELEPGGCAGMTSHSD